MSVQRNRPTPTGDSASTVVTPSRSDQYLAAYVSPITSKEWLSADEGSYFVVGSTTPGTGIIGHAAPTTFDQTKAYIYIYNGGTNRIYPQYIRLHNTVVSIGDSRVQFTFVLDNTNRYSSGGSNLTTLIYNTNMGSTNASGAVVYQGAAVLATNTANSRTIGNYCLRGTIDVVEDTYQFVFGSPDGVSGATSRVATVLDVSQTVSPVVLQPGTGMAIHQWAGSQSTGPTYEMVMGFIER